MLLKKIDTMLPYGRQDITKEDIKAVQNVLESCNLTQGPMVPEFEQSVVNYCNAKYGIAVNSATSALHLACIALGLGEGDWLWTSPISFVASANCGLYCGAQIDFVDIDKRTYNLCPIQLEKKLILAEANGRLPKVVVPVHMCGQSCDMEAISLLRERYGFRILEDASHAIGGRYQNEPIGNCRYSDITVFSFHPVKIITTGEGGMAVTNSDELASRMFLLRSHGITRDEKLMKSPSDGPWYYQQVDLGFNYRMTDIQAALGVSQIQRLNNYVSRRQEIANIYGTLLDHLPVITPWQNKDSYSSYHLYIIRLKLKAISVTHLQVFESLRRLNIGVNLHYIPIHTQPYYQEMGFKTGDFPIAESYYNEAISLPIFPAMCNKDVDRVVDALIKSLQIEIG